MGALKAKQERALREIEESHAADISHLNAQIQGFRAAKESDATLFALLEQQRADAETSYATELAQAKASHAAVLAKTNESHASELAALTEKHAEAVRSLQAQISTEKETALEDLQRTHAESMAALQTQYGAQENALEAKLSSATGATAETHRKT